MQLSATPHGRQGFTRQVVQARRIDDVDLVVAPIRVQAGALHAASPARAPAPYGRSPCCLSSTRPRRVQHDPPRTAWSRPSVVLPLPWAPSQHHVLDVLLVVGLHADEDWSGWSGRNVARPVHHGAVAGGRLKLQGVPEFANARPAARRGICPRARRNPRARTVPHGRPACGPGR
jgi:hypothetical protein